VHVPVVALDLNGNREVAARNGMLVGQDDPGDALVPMNEVVLQQVMGVSEDSYGKEIVAGIEAAFLSAQRRSVGKVEGSAEGRNRRA